VEGDDDLNVKMTAESIAATRAVRQDEWRGICEGEVPQVLQGRNLSGRMRSLPDRFRLGTRI